MVDELYQTRLDFLFIVAVVRSNADRQSAHDAAGIRTGGTLYPGGP